MFLPREKKILKLLLNSEKKFTTSQIAAELKVSPRTIKADIKKINDTLKNDFCQIRTKQGVGLWLDYDRSRERYLNLLIYEDEEAGVSLENRKYYVAAELLLSRDYISMETIANKLYVSKGTVVNDIAELENFCNRFEISFVKKVKYGVRAQGEEIRLRLALVEALKQAVKQEGRVSLERLQNLLETVDLAGLREIVLKSEQRFHFILSDVSFDEFVIQLAVLTERLGKGLSMRQLTEEDGKDVKREALDSRERREWFVIQYLRGQIEDFLDTCIPDTEDFYLHTCFQGLRFQVPMVQETDKDKLRSRAPELFDYMMSVISEVDEQYHLKLKEDPELYCAMFNHLECMIHRIQSKLFLENPILNSLKKEMVYEYEIASYFMSKFSARYDIRPTEDEIGYLTFYIGAALERMKETGRQILAVTLVCTTGAGTSQFLSVKLKRLFPDMEIRNVIPSNQVSRLKTGEQDLVISTVPLHREDLNIIQVSSVLNDRDVQKIERYMEKRSILENESSYQCLKKLLHEKITILDCDLRSKEEAIRLLGGRMCMEGYVDEGYIDSVFNREEVSETAIGNRVAIPHAFKGHVRKQGIGLLTLQKPVSWGNERVQIVFLLALEASRETDLQGIFQDILSLTQNAKDLESLLRVRKYGEINIWEK